MKNFRIYNIVLLILIIFISGIWATISLAGQENKLLVQIKPMNSVVELGEIVNLDIIFQNSSNKDVAIFENPIDSGTIKIFISKNGDKYREYVFGGKVRGFWGILKSGEKNVFQKSIIYNPKPNHTYNNDIKESRILTDYAFPEAGVYSIKVISYYKNVEDVKDIYKPEISIESEPIQITVKEPTGENKEVWNKIKDNPGIAYFMQDNEVLISNEKIGQKGSSLKEIEEIVAQYPNSLIGKQLQLGRKNFVEKEERRKESFKNIRQQNRPQ